LPLCHLQIKALRCPHPHRWKCTQRVPVAPQTIGDHIKKQRLRFHLMQADLAAPLGVHRVSIQNWERNIGIPMPSQLPAIIKFLGYVPFQHDGTPGGKDRWLRLCAGWTQGELAVAAGCDGSTVDKWEMNRPFPTQGWHRGLAVLCERFQKLGLSELTAEKVAWHLRSHLPESVD
jgi:DNA-binding transcriptional regulator YiaG